MPAPLIALFTAVCYASALVAARRGLGYSTPTTVTCVSVMVQNGLLWSAVFLTGGVPAVSPVAIGLFVIVGFFQLGVRLFAYTGVHKIGASRSSALQAISPLIAALIAITLLHERPGPSILGGTIAVVAGIVLVSWRPEREIPTFRWWHLLLPIAAACLTGMNHPIRRYALSLSNEPLFFAAFMGAVSSIAFLGYLPFTGATQRLAWDRKALGPFLLTGLFETLSIFLIILALSVGPVVVVAPIAATYPVWALLGTNVFLRDVERVTAPTVLGVLSVVVGTVAIHLGR